MDPFDGAAEIDGDVEADTVDVGKLKLPTHVKVAGPVSVQKGDEEEEEVFKGKCKLLHFIKEDSYGGETRKNFWRERGLGNLRILKHKVTGKFRVLMRQDKTKKICLNCYIDPKSAAKPQTAKATLIYAFDSSEGESKGFQCSLKFGDEETNDDFGLIYLHAQREVGKLSGVSVAVDATQETKIAEYLVKHAKDMAEAKAEKDDDEEEEEAAPAKTASPAVKAAAAVAPPSFALPTVASAEKAAADSITKAFAEMTVAEKLKEIDDLL